MFPSWNCYCPGILPATNGTGNTGLSHKLNNSCWRAIERTLDPSPVGGILIKEIKLFIASTLRVASLCWHQPSCPWHLFPFLENKAGTTVPFLRIPLPPSPFLPPGSLTRLIARGETRRKRIDRAILKSSTRRGEKQGCNSRKRRARRSIVRVFVQTLSYKCPALFSAFHAFERFV